MSVPLAGYLLASPDDTAIGRRALAPLGHVARKAPFLRYEQPFERSRYWEEYTFHSDRSFTRDPGGSESQPPYRYGVYCARSGSKLIILTEQKRLTGYIIDSLLNTTIFPNLKHVSFRIDKMVPEFEHSDSKYRVTALHGRFSGPDRALRTMILYGTEVTNSAVYSKCGHLFNFYSCGIADRMVNDPFSVTDHGEIARLGDDGSIWVASFNRRRAMDLNRIVNYVISNKWVDDWVVPSSENRNDVDAEELE